MESIKTEIHRCEFCRKYWLRKHVALRHEKYCSKNPANHAACFSCKFLKVENVMNSDAEYHRYPEKTFKCTKLDTDLHSFKAEKIGHSCLGYTELMPKSCDHYEEYALVFPPEHKF